MKSVIEAVADDLPDKDFASPTRRPLRARRRNGIGKKNRKSTFAGILAKWKSANLACASVNGHLVKIAKTIKKLKHELQCDAALPAELDTVRKERLDRAEEQHLALLEKAKATRDTLETISARLEGIKAAEIEKYPQHFAKTGYEKALLLLLGWMEGGPGPKNITLHYVEPDSFLDYECRFAVFELLRNGDRQMCNLIASLFVPDDDHPLAHWSLKARLSNRRAGATSIPYIVEQITSAVEGFKEQGLKTDGAVNAVADHYEISREYIYRCLRQDG
ncbi:hypothetical protein QD460_26020 [Rhizobium jaguaris]|uniref:hypothetical protein n=1 Tax=Rhizobium jaguaris TaxID=1312183 RepID=UPI0039BFD003